MSVSLPPLGDLREAVEFLAWRGLESDSIGITEVEANRFLRGQELKEQSDVYIERLVRIGVLRRAGARLRFTYPIIQEYLAACWMIINTPEKIGPRFADISHRPWAQALQFALEMYPNSENIINNQLKVPDDVFNTKLRLIARCIVNGAKVSIEIRRIVGEHLTAAWPSEAYAISQSIGYLLADGFTDLLPPKAIEHISDWALQYGGAEIVVAKSSPAFTLEILKKFISGDLSYSYVLYGWQIAVDEIADEALDLYLERVCDKRTTKKELDSLSSLIASLAPSQLRLNRWSEIAADTSLPSIIRLAGYQLGPRPIDLSAWLVIDNVIRLSELDETNNFSYLAYKLYWHMQDVEGKFVRMLNDTTVPEKRIHSILLVGLMGSEMENEAKRAILRQAMSKSKLSQNVRFLMLLCLAVLGDEVAEQETIPMLFDQGFDYVNAWLYQANKFCKKTVCDAAKILSSRQIDSNHLLQLIDSADFGLSNKTDVIISFNSAAAYEPWIHPARGDMLSYLCANLKEDDENIDILAVRLQTGDIKVREKLIIEMEKFVANFPGVMPSDDDQKISNTLYRLEQQSISVPLDLLFQIVDKSSSDAGRQAIDWIVRSGDKKVTLKLLEHFNSRDKFREAIFTGLETLAGRYNLRIIRDDAKLIIE